MDDVPFEQHASMPVYLVGLQTNHVEFVFPCPDPLKDLESIPLSWDPILLNALQWKAHCSMSIDVGVRIIEIPFPTLPEPFGKPLLLDL